MSSRRSSRVSRHATDCKLYVGELGNHASKEELEDAFGYYGQLRSVWVARNPPGFAFVEFVNPRDAQDAVAGLDGRTVCGRRIRVEESSTRLAGRSRAPRGSRGRPFNPDDRCYECGERGHYARDCRLRVGDKGRGGPRRRSRSRSPRSRSRSRSRSGRRGSSRSRSRSPRKSRDRDSRERRRKYSRSHSRSRSNDKSVKRRDRSESRENGKKDSRSRSRSRDNHRRSNSRASSYAGGKTSRPASADGSAYGGENGGSPRKYNNYK